MNKTYPLIATPVSYSLFTEQNRGLIIEHSDCLEGRPETSGNPFGTEKVFHYDEIEPCHHLSETTFSDIRSLILKKKDLECISFHVAFCTNPKRQDENVYTKRYTRDELYDNCKKNIARIKEIIGPNISILLENNNYFKEELHRDVTDGDFLSSLVYDNDIFFLLDTAHARVTCSHKNIDYENYLKSLPLKRCKQIHLSRVDEDRQPLIDSHLCPQEKEFLELVDILKQYNTIEYITIEHYEDINSLIESIQRLKSFLKNAGFRK